MAPNSAVDAHTTGINATTTSRASEPLEGSTAGNVGHGRGKDLHKVFIVDAHEAFQDQKPRLTSIHHKSKPGLLSIEGHIQ